MLTRLREKWKSWRRNARILVGDVAFSRNLKILGVVVFLSVLCFVALWYLGVGIKAEVYNQVNGRHVLTFHEYLFSVLGAIDADPMQRQSMPCTPRSSGLSAPSSSVVS